MISEDEAREIARQAILGKIEPQQGAEVRAERRRRRWVVTFVHVTPPDELGPDYDARVTIDAETGEVVEILGGT